MKTDQTRKRVLCGRAFGAALLLAALLPAAATGATGAAADGLAAGFADPPRAAGPYAWWHWMNGNITRDGITRDLESMAANGFGGATIIDAGHGKAGPVAFASEEWFGMVEHAVREARRLGLEIGLANCSGWSSSGGPWIAPSNSMKTVVFTETRVAGGRRFEGRLPRTADDNGFYRDVAVLAFPVPAADLAALPAAEERAELPDDWTHVRTFAFARPETVSGVTVNVSGGCGWIEEAEVAVERESSGGGGAKLVAC